MKSDFAFASAYIVCHLGIYLIFLRRLELFRREPVIFLFHAVSILLMGLLLFERPERDIAGGHFAGLVAAIALHAIYSLSFLELWALAKTGYSLRILWAVGRVGLRTTREIVRAHLAMSDQKKRGRMRSLLALRLVHEEKGLYSLTAFGRLVAAVLAAIAATSRTQEVG